MLRIAAILSQRLNCCLDEQDAFESDFESTDEEDAAEVGNASAEKTVRDEERKVQKV